MFGVTMLDSAGANDVVPSVGRRRYRLQGGSRALRLQNALAGSGIDGLSLAEAAQRCDATKGTTFSLLRTLMDFDCVNTFDRGPRYRLSPLVVHLADGYRGSMPWLEVARPVARVSTDRTGWTSRSASSTELSEEPDHPGPIHAGPEHCVPFDIRGLPHPSSAGEAILACLPEADVRRVIADSGLRRRTRNTITDVDSFFQDLQLKRDSGFAVDDEEDDEGVFCIAAAFRARNEYPLGAISITALKADMPAWRVTRFGRAVCDAADRIAADIVRQGLGPDLLVLERCRRVSKGNAVNAVNDAAVSGEALAGQGPQIRLGSFELDGRPIQQLSINEGHNHLHGDDQGFHKHIWDTSINDTTKLPERKDRFS